MKPFRALLALLLLHVGSGSVAAQSTGAEVPQDTAAVASWIRQSAVALRTVRAGSGFADLEPLEAVLRDVRIVGLGEATHGTSEFQQVKHRMLEFLVTRMGFTAFAIEAAYSDAQPINEYILHGTGNRADVLTGQGYVAWDTEEFSAMLDWLRAYNRTVPEARKVRFHGVDLFRNRVGRVKVLAVVRRVAPTLLARTDSVFRLLAREEERWPMEDSTVVAATRPLLDSLATVLGVRRDSLRGRVPLAEYDEALQLIRVMRQSAAPADRSRYLAENLLYLVDHERPGTKFVFWAHNGHVGYFGSGSAGSVLRRQLGDAYYAVALTFDRGAYLSRLFPPPGDFRVAQVPPAPPGSLDWHLARTGMPQLFLDVRARPAPPTVESWLRTRRRVHSANWAYQDSTPILGSTVVRDNHDGILFVAESTPTHPTPNAKNTVARKAGF